MMESFTLGWLNMLVQSAWGPLLERFVSGITAEKLQLILNEVRYEFLLESCLKDLLLAMIIRAFTQLLLVLDVGPWSPA
jgi:hypothetical protein